MRTLLELSGIRKSYGNFMVLDGLSFTLEEGELYGFVGTNGAGKTTTLRIAAGLLPPDEGEVFINGKPLWEMRSSPRASAEFMREIGYVPDFFGVYDNLRVMEYMEFFASCYGLSGLPARRRCEMLLDQTGLYEKTSYFVSSLSRGMKQRLCLARALIHDPAILILDEPASGLDPITRNQYMAILGELREQGKTLLISSHILSELSDICTSAGIIEGGKMLVSGRMQDILTNVNLAHRITIQAAGDRTPLLRILRDNPQVRAVAMDSSEIRIEFTGQQEDEERLLRELFEGGVRLTGFMRQKDDLEAAFMTLSGKKNMKAVVHYEMESGFPEGDPD